MTGFLLAVYGQRANMSPLVTLLLILAYFPRLGIKISGFVNLFQNPADYLFRSILILTLK